MASDATPMMDPWQARVDLAASLRWCARLGLHEGVDNHFSLIVPGTTDRFLLNPHRRHWAEVRASDLVEVDGDGNPVDGKKPPEQTAFYIHSEVHKRCSHAICVMHTHMTYTTALTMIEGGRLEPVVQSALKFQGQIAYDDAYGGLAFGVDEGARIAKALGDKRIALLANHGVMVVGPSVGHALNDLYYLERSAKAQIVAMSTGRPLRRIRQDIAEATFQQMQSDRDDQAHHHLAAIKRILDREEPDYAH